MPRCLQALFALVLAILASGPARAADADLLKRGEYLARAGDCVACHTRPGGEPFAGGRRLDTPFGAIYSPNLTPDKETGIGGWSDDDFYRALHEGIGKNGEYLYPAFPFPWYTKVTRDDALAIKAYLFSLPPVREQNKPVAFSFPFDVREGLATWRLLFFKPAEPKQPDDKLSRGAYLVEGLGHYGECHNRHNVLGASDWSGKYEGGAVNGWYAPNITADGRQGVGQWSEDDLVNFLKTGASSGHGVALGPMQETIDDSLSHLSDDDLHAMAAYLKSVRPEETFANNKGAYHRKGAPGEDVYLAQCASCHGPDGKGQPGRVPGLAGNGAVMAGGPENVIRAVLGGLPPAHGLGPMPAVGASLSDEDVARVADYVRNSFGNAAPATSEPKNVAAARKSVRTTMAPVEPSDCATIGSPQIQALIDSGAIAKVAGSDPIGRIGAVDDLLEHLKPPSPTLLADLTAAYCRASFADNGASHEQRAERIGQLAVLTYSRALAPTKLGDAR